MLFWIFVPHWHWYSGHMFHYPTQDILLGCLFRMGVWGFMWYSVRAALTHRPTRPGPRGPSEIKEKHYSEAQNKKRFKNILQGVVHSFYNVKIQEDGVWVVWKIIKFTKNKCNMIFTSTFIICEIQSHFGKLSSEGF